MIITAGLSPAWQQILVLDEVAAGEVNRAAEVVWCASGKVLNVARAAWLLGADIDTLSPLGGWTGDAIREEFAADGIPAAWITTAAPTRVCTTVIEQSTGRVTEFVENARAITAGELEEFIAAYLSRAVQSDTAVLTGSLPKVDGPEQPVGIWKLLLREGPRAILDVRGPELIEALPERPFLVKPNRAELSQTIDRTLESDEAVLQGMCELNAAGAEWVLITHGSKDALLTSRESAWRFAPPPADVVNPIGCGDCLAAGIAVALDDGAEMVEAVRFGLAAAAENLGQLLPARLDRDRVTQRSHDIRTQSIA